MVSRNYCFTQNNYTDVEEKEIYIFFENTCKYGIYGREIGEVNKTPHLQGFFVLLKPIRIKKIIGMFVKRAHLEICRGDAISNFNYCTKDSNYVEYGNKDTQGQGKRNDLKEFVENIKIKNNVELIENYPDKYLKYYKGVDRIRFEYDKLLQNKFDPEIECFALIGKPGIGKTRYIFDKHSPENCFKLEDTSNIWFDGYDGHSVLIIDDFYGGIKYNYLLNLIDKYHMRLPIKGGHTI